MFSAYYFNDKKCITVASQKYSFVSLNFILLAKVKCNRCPY